ncbi:MAG: thermonuclease family protein [Campylobacterota bacterium]|nr:thermonuclease family protein [Campylobacterota bacterium]
MRKIIVFMLSSSLIFGALYAKEPLLAELNSIHSNETQSFSVGSYAFTCETYGVLALDTLYKNSKKGSACQKSIDKLYRINTGLKYYTRGILKTRQLYHIEIKNKKCIVYAKGQMSLSELLLQNGLAIKKPVFNDEEFSSDFTKAQMNAKIHRKGLWKEGVFKACIEVIN